ncbi:MAG: ABC transporter permease, partial [Lachnospiraceae bacterium]|nr:ABC transporter permease [Lachnospiraceae bacterium]
MTWPFENDTSAIEKKLATRSIKTDNRRNLFMILTIALAVALMSAIFCAAAASDRALEDDIRGQYQAVVVNCDWDMIKKLSNCPE